MNILLTAATPEELAPTLAWLRERADGTERNFMRFGNVEVHLLFTGMGPLATAYALGAYLTNHAVQLAIQGGIAGAFDRDLAIGEVVRVENDRLLDFGAEDRDGSWLNLADMGFRYATPFQEDGSLKPITVSAQYLPYRVVSGGTTGRSSGSRSTIDRLRRQFPEVQIETMEGAAFFYATQMAGVEPLQLRAISNYVTERDRESWQIGKAIAALDGALQRVLGAFMEQA
ncbi:futalosine hydrolase [Neolewinella xylanilytica]|uniref:Futalosine hydrolase n=1 Tax=Neolewinella xylanilytica TaxID=1514080 RepID=A0A2S6I652_9BACT|nr:futalosine hydrolase [Neolewinella xylanilytica]PPK86662.1 futalosine hydrolase [Neolewinella xylanilytica]